MKIDKLLFLIIISLTIGGAFVFYEVSSVLFVKSQSKINFLFIKFLLGNIFLPFLFFFIFSLMKWKFLRKITPFLFLASFIFLILSFLWFFKLPGQSTARWFYFKGFSFQPVEFLKIFALLFLAFLIPLIKKDKFYFLLSAIIIGFILFLIYKQPALSNLIIFICGIVGGFLGVRFSYKNLIFIGLLILAIILIGFTQEYRIKRVLGILGGDEKGVAYQLRQTRLAISSGGLFGKGIGNSEFKLLGIPLMISDSIFAIYAEETGFIGSLGLIITFLFLVYWIFNKAKRVNNEEKKFFAYGFGTMLSSQVFIHIFSNIILTTGIPLPFFSYGPSNMISLMIGLGIINSLEHS